MIYITGDCHSDFTRFSTKKFPVQKDMTKNDYVIICGDFGGVWNYMYENTSEKYWLDWLNDKNFTTLFVDGNHENFTRLYEYPIKQWCGGKVHKIRDSVFHLMRGEIYNIDGKKFFTFGGASSHDIRDGILNLDEQDAEQEAENIKSSISDNTLNKLAKYVHKTLDLSNLDCDYDINNERCRSCVRRRVN